MVWGAKNIRSMLSRRGSWSLRGLGDVFDARAGRSGRDGRNGRKGRVAGVTGGFRSRSVWIALAAILIVVTAAAGLSGCLIRFTRPGVTIVIWDGPRWADETGNRYHWVQGKIAEFEASHPFVEVILVPVEWDRLREMLDAAKEAGCLPDLAPMDLSAGGISLEEIAEGLLEPVDGHISRPEDISERALEAYSHAGRLWGFPSTMTGHNLLLNLDLFAERGVQPPEGGRWTWSQFIAACQTLTFDRDGDRVTDVWGFSAFVLPGYYELWPFLYGAGARPLSDDLATYTFDSAAAEAALQRLTDLIFTHRAAHPMTGSAAVRSVFELFADADKQKVAIQPWSAWAIDYLTTQEGAIKNFAVADYPTEREGEIPVGVGGTGGLVVFRQDDSHQRNLVMSLANYLTGTAAQYEMARGYRVFPARRGALDLDPFSGNQAYQRAAETAFRSAGLPKHPLWPEIDRLIQKELQMALLGIRTPSQALRTAGSLVSELLGSPASEN